MANVSVEAMQTDKHVLFRVLEGDDAFDNASPAKCLKELQRISFGFLIDMNAT